ncbi:1,5-anhydro-D-fructose reductase-like isoform X1 [Zootermopsis nevadensis]|uniref:1,5-anhydro-D-fructose reductase n=1 Tax=Zootermopsis nevadensis TaxID=136037 RepID=A0A067QUA4_ZOONE|nr:1,5-anhydro-D-fructose reductase-like isoform X1 [Zootermopsis nevadensis]KDR07717.1 1,5-anhydro-D-fructose reductase [Zootermopsis nevadensis]
MQWRTERIIFSQLFQSSMVSVHVPSLTFSNGYKMPVIGLGTWKSKPGDVQRAVVDAIDAGYRHLDCAYMYGNESEVGEGVKLKVQEGVVQREDLFITSKLWNTFHRPDLVVSACKKSLSLLGLEYVDLYLMHWPFAFKEDGDLIPTDADGNIVLSDVDYLATWREMETCVHLGLTHSIGLSNFNSQQIERLLVSAEVKPANLQIECNPYLTQKKLINFCQSRGIEVTAYSPMGSPDSPYLKAGMPRLLEDPGLHQVAHRVGKSVGQVVLRYLVQQGISAVPKSVTKSRIQENINIFDFELSDADTSYIDSFNQNLRICHRDHARGHKFYPFNVEF